MQGVYNKNSRYIDEVLIIGDEFLCHERITNGEDGNEQKIQTNLKLDYISVDDLLKFRYKRTPMFILKLPNGDIKYCIIHDDWNLSSKILIPSFKHQCLSCHKLIALPSSCGGCDKVRDRSFEDICYKNDSDLKLEIDFSKRIERYDFIEYGYETVNTVHDCFVVLICKRFEKIVEKKK